MELKRHQRIDAALYFVPFNRTTMELKLWADWILAAMPMAFNRTTMELKRRHANPDKSDTPPFNRTTMELKPSQ